MLENQIDILARNETFFKSKIRFHVPGYDRWHSHPGKKGIIVNQEWKNEHFNVITDNEVLVIEIELQNGDKIIMATIYCPNGNPI